ESCTPRLMSALPPASRSVTVMATTSVPSASAFACETSMVDLSLSIAAPTTQVPPALHTRPLQLASEVHCKGAGALGEQATAKSRHTHTEKRWRIIGEAPSDRRTAV